MPVIPFNLIKESKIRQYINQFLMNTGQDCEEEWWNNPKSNKALIRLAGAIQPQVSDSFELCIDCEDILVIGCWNGGTDVGALEQLMVDVQNTVEKLPAVQDSAREKTVHFLFFTKDLKSRTALEMKLDQSHKKVLANAARKSIGLPVECRYTFVIDREYRDEMARIGNINRFDSIPMPPVSGSPNTDITEHPSRNSPHSIVLTVPLRQLVDLYNQVGDQLFNRNVRLGIGDKLDVQMAMYQTLEKEPEYFWYMNNGITLLVVDPDFRLCSADSLELGVLAFESEPHFSVINGAQTISICSKYAFEWEYYKENCPEQKEEAERRLSNFEKAQVILRVIHVPIRSGQSISAKEQENALAQEHENIRLANNISISLNRQKPVEQEDIAFTTPFVQKMLEYLEYAPDAPFRLVRRGENSDYTAQLDLVAFSKARLACVDQPGSARSVSRREIMKIKSDMESFQNTDIFTEEWLADDTERNEVFRRFYGAVLFASQLEACYKENQKTVQNLIQKKGCDRNALIALRNGSWYFTALLVQLLNDFSKDDYSKFDCTISAIEDKLPQAMSVFSRMAVFCAEKKQTLNSNDFKKEELYMRMRNKLEEPGRTAIFKEFVDLFAAFVKNEEKTKSERIQVVYGPSFRHRDPASVEFVADAFAMTVGDVLSQFKPDPAKLERFSAWLTTDWEKCLSSHNYIKNPPHILYNGNTYWIGTSISNHSKCVYIDRLCLLAGVPKGEITWKKGKDTLYEW